MSQFKDCILQRRITSKRGVEGKIHCAPVAVDHFLFQNFSKFIKKEKKRWETAQRKQLRNKLLKVSDGFHTTQLSNSTNNKMMRKLKPVEHESSNFLKLPAK